VSFRVSGGGVEPTWLGLFRRAVQRLPGVPARSARPTVKCAAPLVDFRASPGSRALSGAVLRRLSPLQAQPTAAPPRSQSAGTGSHRSREPGIAATPELCCPSAHEADTTCCDPATRIAAGADLAAGVATPHQSPLVAFPRFQRAGPKTIPSARRVCFTPVTLLGFHLQGLDPLGDPSAVPGAVPPVPFLLRLWRRPRLRRFVPSEQPVSHPA
jgi:hypothetical protein